MWFSPMPHPQGQVLGLGARQAGGQLLLVAAGLGRDRDRQQRVGHGRRRQRDRVVLGAQRVAGGGVGQLGHRTDVAGDHLVGRLLRLAADGQQVADPLVLALGRVEHRGVGQEGAGHHPEQVHPPHVRVGDGLEHVGGQRAGRVGAAPLHRRALGGGGERLGAHLQQLRDADVAGRGPGQHREQAAGSHRLLQVGDQVGGGDLLAAEVAVHQGLVLGLLDDRLDQLLAQAGGGLLQVGGDVALGALAALVGERAARQQPDQAAEVVLLADRQVQRRAALAEGALDAVQGAGERRPVAVELVDEERPRQAELLGHGPHDLGLGLHPLHGADHEQHRVGGRQGGPHVADEVGVAGRVQQVDLEAVVLHRRHRQRHRDLLAGLLRLEVGHGGAVLHPADPVGRAGGVQHRLDQGGLAGAPVTHDQDVADVIGGVALHVRLASLVVAPVVARERRCYHRSLP
jgi:hypothetical protein